MRGIDADVRVRVFRRVKGTCYCTSVIVHVCVPSTLGFPNDVILGDAVHVAIGRWKYCCRFIFIS